MNSVIFFGQLVRLFDVAFVELEVHLQRFVRDAFEATQVELSCFVRTLSYSFVIPPLILELCSKTLTNAATSALYDQMTIARECGE